MKNSSTDVTKIREKDTVLCKVCDQDVKSKKLMGEEPGHSSENGAKIKEKVSASAPQLGLGSRRIVKADGEPEARVEEKTTMPFEPKMRKSGVGDKIKSIINALRAGLKEERPDERQKRVRVETNAPPTSLASATGSSATSLITPRTVVPSRHIDTSFSRVSVLDLSLHSLKVSVVSIGVEERKLFYTM